MCARKRSKRYSTTSVMAAPLKSGKIVMRIINCHGGEVLKAYTAAN